MPQNRLRTRGAVTGQPVRASDEGQAQETAAVVLKCGRGTKYKGAHTQHGISSTVLQSAI